MLQKSEVFDELKLGDYSPGDALDPEGFGDAPATTTRDKGYKAIIEGAQNIASGLRLVRLAAPVGATPTGFGQAVAVVIALEGAGLISMGLLRVQLGLLAAALGPSLSDSQRAAFDEALKLLDGVEAAVDDALTDVELAAKIAALDAMSKVLKSVGLDGSNLAEKVREMRDMAELEQVVRDSRDRGFARERGRTSDDPNEIHNHIDSRDPTRDPTRDYREMQA